MPICPMCDSPVEKLKSNSHIIPKWVVKDIKGSDKNLILLEQDTVSMKLVQDGFKADIVCQECENEFQKDDHYAARILRSEENETPKYRSLKKEKIGLSGEKWDGLNVILFKRFVIGIILRSQFLKIKEEGRSNLNAIYLQAMKSQYSEPNIDIIPIILLINDYYDGIIYPSFYKFSGYNSWRFELKNYTFIAITSNHFSSSDFKLITLQPSGIIHIPYTRKDGDWYRNLTKLAHVLRQKYRRQ